MVFLSFLDYVYTLSSLTKLRNPLIFVINMKFYTDMTFLLVFHPLIFYYTIYYITTVSCIYISIYLTDGHVIFNKQNFLIFQRNRIKIRNLCLNFVRRDVIYPSVMFKYLKIVLESKIKTY